MYCLSSFCCVCLKDGIKLQDINQLDIDGLSLINKIIFVSFGHEAIDFQVVRHICFECTNTLQLAYKFKRSCLVNHELLRTYSGQLKYFTGKVSEYWDLAVTLEKLPEKSGDDDAGINREDTLTEKKDVGDAGGIVLAKKTFVSPKNKQQKTISFKCTSCDLSFHRYVLLQVHYSTKHKSLFKVIKKKISSKESTLSYSCNICSSKLATLYSLTRHLQLHKNPENTCKFCPTQIENNDQYKKHILTNHSNRGTLRCHICEQTLENDFNFRRHMFLKHSPKKCKYCEKIFLNNTDLLAHTTQNHRTHKCTKCIKAFTLKKSLQAHMKTHDNNKNDFEEPPAPAPPPPPPPQQAPVIEAEIIPETSEINQLINKSALRRKCTNCLSIFSSSLTLKRHKCFKLKNMYQCNICFIIYSKKSCFINHVKNCTLARNISNTPELQECEQTFSEASTSQENQEIQENQENRGESQENQDKDDIKDDIKDENDLDIKEELVEDFSCNTQKSIKIGEVYSIQEPSQQQPQQQQHQQEVEAPKSSPKKTFPKIKLFEKNLKRKLSNSEKISEDYTDIIRAVKLRRNDSSSNTSNKESTSPEINIESDVSDATINEATINEATETIFANKDQIIEFSDSNDSTKLPEVQTTTDPLFDVIESNNSSRRTSVSGDDPNVPTKTKDVKKVKINERRKSIWIDDLDHLIELSDEDVINSQSEPKKSCLKIRTSIFSEDTSNESFIIDTPPTTTKTTKTTTTTTTSTTKDSDSFTATEDNNSVLKKLLVKHCDYSNTQPIILKTRRNIKKIKPRRKSTSALLVSTESQEKVTVENVNDVNENIANVDDDTDVTLKSISLPDTRDFIATSIQSFKLKSLRRQSVCSSGDEQSNHFDDNDTNYITVRKVSDINNDISVQPD